MSELYEKRGRRYVKVAEDREWDSLPMGFTLVFVGQGIQQQRFRINPAYADLLAASAVAREAALEAALEADKARPERSPLTDKQRKAWEALNATFSGGLCRLGYESLAAIVDAAIDALVKAAQERRG